MFDFTNFIMIGEFSNGPGLDTDVVDTSDFNFRDLFATLGMDDTEIEKGMDIVDFYAFRECDAKRRRELNVPPLYSPAYYASCKRFSRQFAHAQSSHYLTFAEILKVISEDIFWTLLDREVLEVHPKWNQLGDIRPNTPLRINMRTLHEFQEGSLE